MDELMERYFALSAVQEFDENYPISWYQLARDFDVQGRVSMAETCRNRGEFYADLGVGEFVKVSLSRSFVEIVQK